MILDTTAARTERLDALLDDVTSVSDPVLRDQITEVITELLSLYGEGLARILQAIEERLEESAARDLLDAFTADELVSHLLLLHDLHPVDVQTRVTRALDGVRPYLQSHGGDVELLGIEDGIVRLRLQGSCNGCPSSTMTLKMAIEEAIQRAAPELDGIDADGVSEPPRNFVPIGSLRTEVPHRPSWTEIEGLDALVGGVLEAREVRGRSLLFLRLPARRLQPGDALMAYVNACPACGRALAEGTLAGETLICPGCLRRYDVRHAGRCEDAAARPLEPVPLLVRDGVVRVAASEGMHQSAPAGGVE